MIKVLLVDDHAIVRDGLKRLLADLKLGPILEAATGELILLAAELTEQRPG